MDFREEGKKHRFVLASVECLKLVIGRNLSFGILEYI